MARLARIVIPGTPHFVTQRGSDGRDVFFSEADAQAYIDLLAEQSGKWGLDIWAWCLMPNRVHLLAVPRQRASLSRALGETHRRYSNMINARTGQDGNIWASRFSSFPLEDQFVLPAAHFIEMTPVMAGVCKSPAMFRWSSAKAHIREIDDGLCDTAPLRARVKDWEEFLTSGGDAAQMQRLTSHITTGRPLGGSAFIERLEAQTGRDLKKKKPGRKAKQFA